MAIRLFCGLPGAGKSYGVVETTICPALDSGRHVYTNIPLNVDACADRWGADIVSKIHNFVNDDVTADFLMAIQGGALIVLDEAWRFFPAGTLLSNLEKGYAEFVAEHRHKVGETGVTQEIVFVTQDPSQIMKSYRALIDQTVYCRKLNSVGKNDSFAITIFSACPRELSSKKNIISTGLGTYKKDIFALYQSHTKNESKSGLAGIEITIDKRGIIWNHPYIKYGVPAALLFAILAGVFGYKAYKSATRPKDVSPLAPPVIPIESVKKTVKPVLPDSNKALKDVKTTALGVPVLSVSFRYTGSFTTPSGEVHLVEHSLTGKMIRLTSGCVSDSGVMTCDFQGQKVTPFTGIPEKPQEGYQDIGDRLSGGVVMSTAAKTAGL